MGKITKSIFGLGAALGIAYGASHIYRDGQDYGSFYKNITAPLKPITYGLRSNDLLERRDLVDKFVGNAGYVIDQRISPVKDSVMETKNDLKTLVDRNYDNIKNDLKEWGPAVVGSGAAGLFILGFLKDLFSRK